MEKEPLHETILRVIYLASPDRPEPLSTDDVYWKIEDPHLQASQVREVLDWLVHRGEMEKDLGRYILTRPKFFELKALYFPKVEAIGSVEHGSDHRSDQPPLEAEAKPASISKPEALAEQEVKEGPETIPEPTAKQKAKTTAKPQAKREAKTKPVSPTKQETKARPESEIEQKPKAKHGKSITGKGNTERTENRRTKTKPSRSKEQQEASPLTIELPAKTQAQLDEILQWVKNLSKADQRIEPVITEFRYESNPKIVSFPRTVLLIGIALLTIQFAFLIYLSIATIQSSSALASTNPEAMANFKPLIDQITHQNQISLAIIWPSTLLTGLVLLILFQTSKPLSKVRKNRSPNSESSEFNRRPQQSSNNHSAQDPKQSKS